MVGKALDIARYTNEDRHAGLVDGDGLSRFYADLKLDNAWDLSIEEALEHAHRVEAGIRAVGRDVRSDGASLSTSRSQFQLVTSRGFCRTATRTDHNISARVIANRDGQNKPDAWTDYQVAPHHLQAPEATGERAARSALEALGGCSISSRSCPVLFAPKAAHSLTQHFFQAVNGGELSRGSSFLRGSLGQVIFAEHIDVLEDPFLVGGAASACFDTDGVVGQRRAVVKHGMVSGYFLNGIQGFWSPTSWAMAYAWPPVIIRARPKASGLKTARYSFRSSKSPLPGICARCSPASSRWEATP